MHLLGHARMDANPPIADPVFDAANIELFTEGLKALGDPHRLKILYLLLTCGEMCVCECIPALDISQSNLSFHLKTLRQAGFIKARKFGRWIYYFLNRPVLDRFLAVFGGVFDLEKWPEKPRCAACDDILHSTTWKRSSLNGTRGSSNASK